MTDQQILTEIRDEMRAVREQITEIRILDVEQTASLKEHIKRSDNLEKIVASTRNEIKLIEDKLTRRLDSDQTFRRWFLGVATIIGTVSSALVAFFMKIL